MLSSLYSIARQNRVTLLVLGENGSFTRSASVSRVLLISLSSILAAVFLISGFAVCDYVSIRKTRQYFLQSQDKLSHQHEEIVRQRKQIQSFAKELNRLKSSLQALNRFEKKIRIITNFENNHVQSGLFGIGGSIAEDINPNIPITRSHNTLMRDMHSQIHLVDEVAAEQYQGLSLLLGYLEDQRNLLASTPSIWPTDGWISSGFGHRISPFSGLREFHKGLDIAAGPGEAVIAPGDGFITFAGRKGTMGKMMVIDHGHGMVTRYGHLQRLLKKRGDTVKRGQSIATVGESGRTTGPHLHYEVHLNGVPVKPKTYLLD